MLQYRMIKKDDVQIMEYHRMRHTLWPNHDEGDLYDEMQKILEGRTFYKNELSWTVFAAVREDESLGGFIEITLYPELSFCSSKPVAYIEGWYVDEDLRRNGVGKGLVDFAKSYALENKCTEITSDVELHNKVSQQAHEALGFIGHKEGECIYYKQRLAQYQ